MSVRLKKLKVFSWIPYPNTVSEPDHLAARLIISNETSFYATVEVEACTMR